MSDYKRFLNNVHSFYPGAEILCVATRLWRGWELDNYYALVQLEEETIILTTDHGHLTSGTTEDLRKALEEYEESKISIQRLLGLHSGSLLVREG